MRYFKILAMCFLCLAFSCKDDERLRIIETQRTEKQNDSILKQISAGWHFNVPPLSSRVAPQLANWNEWRQFTAELAQKPSGGLGAYRQKAKNLVNKADQLRVNIPPFFNKPQVRSRIGVVITKVKSLYTYTNLEMIPDKKVAAIIGEVTREVASLQNQFDEIVRFNEIPKEIGEEEMLRALDTVRMANPEAQPYQAPPNMTPKRLMPQQ